MVCASGTIFIINNNNNNKGQQINHRPNAYIAELELNVVEIKMNLNSLGLVWIPHHDFYSSVRSKTVNVLFTHHSMLC